MRSAAFAAAIAAAALVVSVGTVPAAGGEPDSCTVPTSLAALAPSLDHSADRVAGQQALTIVAIGSSSTQGAGASQLALSYPSRLEAELKTRLPGLAVRVINRGKGGEDVGEEVARLGSDVLAEHPDLVIWQLGTNALLRRDDLVADGELMQRGIAALKAAGSDVVLMDMQYAPRVLARPAHLLMQDMIATAADHGGVPLFRRFGMMRYWQEQLGAPKLVGDDGLHLNDAGYGCLAIALADALVANWSSQVKTVQPRPLGEPKEKSAVAVAGRTHAGTEH